MTYNHPSFRHPAFKTAEAISAFLWNNPNFPVLQLEDYESEHLPRLPDSLKQLEIRRAPNLETLPQLPSGLSCLVLSECPKLHSLPELISLDTINLNGLPSLASLPPIHSVESNPTNLILRHCNGLKNLKGLGDFVTYLAITDCSQLEAIEDLPQTLRSLHVEGCPIVEVTLPEKIQILIIRNCTNNMAIIDLKPTLNYICIDGSDVKMRNDTGR